MSVDRPERAAALARRWHLPFPVLSDPDGERYLRPLGVWNPEDRGGIAVPALIVVAPDGAEVYRFRSRDFADRPSDDDLVAALDGLGLPPGELPPWRPHTEPEEDPEAFRTDAFGPYMRGVRSGSSALARRMVDAMDRAEADTVSSMAGSFLDAWKRRRALVAWPDMRASSGTGPGRGADMSDDPTTTGDDQAATDDMVFTEGTTGAGSRVPNSADAGARPDQEDEPRSEQGGS